jgi:eukaryotic-like serine/threonine-protein kinase
VAGAEAERALSVSTASPRPWLGLPSLALSLGFLLTGLLVGLLRPNQKALRIFALASLLAAAFFLWSPLPYDLPRGWERALVNLLGAPGALVPAVVFHGYYSLPPGTPRGRVWSWIQRLLYAWALPLLCAYNLGNLLHLAGGPASIAFAEEHRLLWALRERAIGTNFAYFAVGAVATLAVMLRNYRLVTDAGRRRRLQWIFLGLGLGMLPSAGLVVALAMAPALGLAPLTRGPGYLWAGAAAGAAALLVPASFLYGVLRRDILDVRFVVRRGLQYALARNVLRAALLLPAVLLALGILSNPDRTVGQILFRRPLYPALMLAAALCLRHRERLGRWIDRRFFREAYASEQVLLALADQVRGRESLGEIARLVSGPIQEALHPESIHLCFLEPGSADFTLQYSSGAAPGLQLREDAPAVHMIGRGGVFDVARVRGELPAQDGEWLRRMGASLAVAVGGGDRRLLGFLLLGPRKSEEPYSPGDRRLLEAVAGQIAVVCENLQLRKRAEQDASMRRDVLARLDPAAMNLLKECPACGACYDRGEESCERDRCELVFTLPVDRTVDGKYRLERLLGKGGMGAVYEASDLRLQRRVAVKLLLGAAFGNEQALRRFEREARASARLRHPHIVTLYDYGQIAPEGAYLVMERLTGTSLRAELARVGALSPMRTAELFAPILDAMAAAHAGGVVHRDLKPENVFLAREAGRAELVKLLDFGLAKLTAGEESQSLTATGTVMGTLAYMSPEQLSGQPVDERTDVFSLGVIAFECVSGRNPFRGEDASRTIAAILHGSVGLEGDAPEVRALDAVLQRCLARRPAERYASVAALRDALVPALRACPPIAGGTRPEGDEATTQVRPE